MTDREREELVLDLTDEWHCAMPGDEAFGQELVEFVASRLGVSPEEAGREIYGPHWPDGAFL